MKHFKLFFLSAFSLSFLARTVNAQCKDPVTLQLQNEIAFPFMQQAFSAEHDLLGKPYLYVASKELGLVIYDVSKINSPVKIKTIGTRPLLSLDVMNLSQQDNYLCWLAQNFNQDT